MTRVTRKQKTASNCQPSVITRLRKRQQYSETALGRCLKHGPQTLSLRECLAVVLGEGDGRSESDQVQTRKVWSRITASLGDRDQERALFLALEELGTLASAQRSPLYAAARARLVAAFEIGRRYHLHRKEVADGGLANMTSEENFTFTALSRVSLELRADTREWLGFVPVYGSGRMGDLCLVERGARTHVNFEPADLFGKLLAIKPRAFYLFHNHPSNILVPSLEDLRLTVQIRKMAKPFNLSLRAHWIVTSEGQCLVNCRY